MKFHHDAALRGAARCTYPRGDFDSSCDVDASIPETAMKGFTCTIARLVAAAFAASFLSGASAASAADVRYVSHRVPVQAAGVELAAMRPRTSPGTAHAPAPLGATANPWHLQATLPGAVIHDLAFPSATVGYAAAELGQVWKTSDGGDTWTEIMNLGYPYYWYGVYAFSENDIVISGFDNQNFLGIVRWSHDGGTTWSDDVVVNDQGWSMRVRYADAESGIVVDLISLTAPNMAHYTTNGGATAADWTSVVPDPNGGWFGNQFSLLAGGHARMSGVTWCDSADAGATWSCGAPVDSVFDGPVFFVDESNGWTGGGTISPDVAGWVHRTTDGGASWSDRTLDSPWPIREILFVDSMNGWAVGGNIYSNAGGIYFSNDGGETWSEDFDSSGHELDACARVGQRIWCAGYDGSFNGAVYALDFDNAPVVQVNPASLSFSVTAGASDSAPLTIANTGTGTLNFEIAEASADSGCSSPSDVPWLSEAPASGSVAPAGTEDVTVSVDASALDPGDYSALLCMTTNDPANALIEVPISLTVGVDDTIFRDGFDGAP
jgi:photosystem II stability/assembly factor-like uncharacterized protein